MMEMVTAPLLMIDAVSQQAEDLTALYVLAGAAGFAVGCTLTVCLAVFHQDGPLRKGGINRGPGKVVTRPPPPAPMSRNAK